jgi:hypothetical protein
MIRVRNHAGGIAVLVAVVVAGCSSTDHTGPGRVHDGKNGFSIVPPAGWTSRGEFMGNFMM